MRGFQREKLLPGYTRISPGYYGRAVSWLQLESFNGTYSEVEARKNGEVSRKALTVAAPRATSPKLLRRIVLVVGMSS
jgi:hypothetical protein